LLAVNITPCAKVSTQLIRENSALFFAKRQVLEGNSNLVLPAWKAIFISQPITRDE
jgi:hypothetical protein